MKRIIIIGFTLLSALSIYAQSNTQIKVYKRSLNNNTAKSKLYTNNKNDKDCDDVQIFNFNDENVTSDIQSTKAYTYFNSDSFKDDMASTGENISGLSQKKIADKKVLSFHFANETSKPNVMVIDDEKQAPRPAMFTRLGNNKNITTVYISKGMLSLASGFAPSVGNIKTKDISKKMDQIEIYTSDNKDGCRVMSNEVNLLNINKSYDLLMKIKDDSNNVSFYGVKEGDIFKEMIMITIDDDDDCSIIRMLGNFTADDVKKIAGN